MSNIGVNSGNTSKLIAQFESLAKLNNDTAKSVKGPEPKPTPPGTGMAQKDQQRLSDLQSRPTSKLTKAEKHELSGLQRQHERPDLLDLAKTTQKTGGVLAGHAVALTKVADERQVCICIRGVNPLATSLVESGFGTKDMSIKAKSSNLPPLNGLIPFDQHYGKKGNVPSDVEKFNHKNEEAIEKKVATSVDAKLPMSHIEMLRDQTNRLSITSSAPGLSDNEILMTGSDFGKDFHFIGVKDGDTVTIFAASQSKDGIWSKDDKPVQVMGNRDGKPVTADYDLAVVAPRLKDLGPQHMTQLKMASFTEVDRRTNVSVRYENALNKLFNDYKSALQNNDTSKAKSLLDQLGKLVNLKSVPDNKQAEIDKQLDAFKSGTIDPKEFKALGRLAAEQNFLGKVVPEALKQTEERYPPSSDGMNRARDIILEALAPPSDTPLQFSEFNEAFAGLTGQSLEADSKFDSIVKNYPNLTMQEIDLMATMLGSTLEGTEGRDTGIISPFVRELVPELNQTVGQTDGLEVFHHGDDSGNPYSVEADNYPMTVILPESATNGGDQIRVITDSKSFLSLAKELKNQGFALPINELWNQIPELKDVRSDDFLSARANLENFFGREQSVEDLIGNAHLSSKV